ncbi:hypothetical protein [Halomonas campaniensis]|uniref:hypothetical protein n=1 Tax=Halomonas campaniensis TaxID=213554 RepID=UPI001F0AFCEE|nr:hypothetical protein [Halomonas campaniensis]
MQPMNPPSKQRTSAATIFKLFVPSALGILIFFVPIEIGGRSTILLDHMVTGLRSLMGDYSGIYALVMIVAGAAYPLFKGYWRRTVTESIFTVLKIIGVVIAVMALTGWGPAFLHEPDMLPFLFEKLVRETGDSGRFDRTNRRYFPGTADQLWIAGVDWRTGSAGHAAHMANPWALGNRCRCFFCG